MQIAALRQQEDESIKLLGVGEGQAELDSCGRRTSLLRSRRDKYEASLAAEQEARHAAEAQVELLERDLGRLAATASLERDEAQRTTPPWCTGWHGCRERGRAHLRWQMSLPPRPLSTITTTRISQIVPSHRCDRS